jgi:hypothetical protein
LHDPAHDVDGSVMSIKQRSSCDDSDFIGRIIQSKRLFNKVKVNGFFSLFLCSINAYSVALFNDFCMSSKKVDGLVVESFVV